MEVLMWGVVAIVGLNFLVVGFFLGMALYRWARRAVWPIVRRKFQWLGSLRKEVKKGQVWLQEQSEFLYILNIDQRGIQLGLGSLHKPRLSWWESRKDWRTRKWCRNLIYYGEETRCDQPEQYPPL